MYTPSLSLSPRSKTVPASPVRNKALIHAPWGRQQYLKNLSYLPIPTYVLHTQINPCAPKTKQKIAKFSILVYTLP